MWITEYNEEMSHAMFRQQGFEEGREEGRDEGREEGVAIGEERGFVKGIAKLVKDGVITLSQAAEQLEMTKTEFAQKAAELGIDVY